ncbi:heme/hemin ABC transporter substrate-binding protein [Lacimicrobium alkaliphilum]|uniref:heme/hemin ABC transporter substrate-binding protein n=1 Tax=Lacimicrobium alkaliphilum TaxID=1526571 RepID=UPI000A5D41F7|nr:ABC transporter substrate-binding protein [Lacimicrobium alkaliphilum]
MGIVTSAARILMLAAGFWLGSPVSVAMAAESRLITAGGTLTDIVFALGAEQALIATDSSSTSPRQARELPQVGYYRDLSSEGVLSFAPHSLWVLEGGGSDKSLRQIEQAGVDVQRFAKPDSVQELYSLIGQLAERLNASVKAETLISQLQQQLAGLEAGNPHRVLFVLQASARGIISAGSDTVPQLLFDYNGLKNIAEHKGFKPVSMEYLTLQQPDMLIAPAHTVASVGGKQAFCAQPSLRLLKAAQQCRLLVMDSLLALGMTTRLPQAIQQVAAFSAQLDSSRNAGTVSQKQRPEEDFYAAGR